MCNNVDVVVEVNIHSFIYLPSADAIGREQLTKVKYCMSGTWNASKAINCVPHDIGDPGK